MAEETKARYLGPNARVEVREDLTRAEFQRHLGREAANAPKPKVSTMPVEDEEQIIQHGVMSREQLQMKRYFVDFEPDQSNPVAQVQHGFSVDPVIRAMVAGAPRRLEIPDGK